MTVSISASLRTGALIASMENDRAAASNGPRKYDPPPGAVSGLNMMAARLTEGAASLSSSSHLPAIEVSAGAAACFVRRGGARPDPSDQFAGCRRPWRGLALCGDATQAVAGPGNRPSSQRRKPQSPRGFHAVADVLPESRVIDPALASLTPKSTRDRFVSSAEDNKISPVPKSSKTTEATSPTGGVAAVTPAPK
jgi:hypothetical protein